MTLPAMLSTLLSTVIDPVSLTMTLRAYTVLKVIAMALVAFDAASTFYGCSIGAREQWPPVRWAIDHLGVVPGLLLTHGWAIAALCLVTGWAYPLLMALVLLFAAANNVAVIRARRIINARKGITS